MVVERPSSIVRVELGSCLTIQHSKEVGRSNHACCQKKSLISVIARSPISLSELLGHCYLGKLFAVVKNTKLSLSGKHFLTCYQTELSAYMSSFVILKYFFLKLFETQFSSGCLFHFQRFINLLHTN